MRPRHRAPRAGFTLIELLVAMAVIVTLAAIAVAVVPGALDQDRTTDAAATIRQHITIAKARATRESLPRGLRLIVGADPNNVAKTNALWVTELQYIEAAPPLIPNPNGTTTPDPATNVPPPYVEFIPTFPTSGADAGNVVVKVVMRNVHKDSDIVNVINSDLKANWFPILSCPSMGLSPDGTGTFPAFEVVKMVQTYQYPDPPTPAGPLDSNSPGEWELTLHPNSTSPQLWLGTGTTTALRVYPFVVRPRSRPILGEPNVQLPKNVCIDLAFSNVPVRTVPNDPANTPIDPELMFAPNGQMIDPQVGGQLYLWVRDYTKFNGALVLTPGSTNPTVIPRVYNSAAFQQGGEQQLVAIRTKTGSLGVFPVQWPDNIAAGTYTQIPSDKAGFAGPYRLAAVEAMSP